MFWQTKITVYYQEGEQQPFHKLSAPVLCVVYVFAAAVNSLSLFQKIQNKRWIFLPSCHIRQLNMLQFYKDFPSDFEYYRKMFLVVMGNVKYPILTWSYKQNMYFCSQ